MPANTSQLASADQILFVFTSGDLKSGNFFLLHQPPPYAHEFGTAGAGNLRETGTLFCGLEIIGLEHLSSQSVTYMAFSFL